MSWTCTCTLSNASLHLACGACGRERPSDEDMALRSREVIDLSGSPAPKRARREATDDLDGFLGQIREAAEDLVKTGPTRAVRAALLRVCTFNVPMGIGVNDLRTGGLVGVDLSLQDVRMRCAAKQMRHVLDDAAELCGAGAPTVFAMQEVKDVPSSAAFPTPRRVLTGMLLRELNALMSAREFVAVNPEWACPIVYARDAMRVLRCGRFLLSDKPGWQSGVPCACGFRDQWVSACHCEDHANERGRPEYKGGGGSWAAFRLRAPAAAATDDGPADLVVVSVHVSNKKTELRARGVREVLAPLVSALRASFGCAVVLTGDFNATKTQAERAHDKRDDADGRGEYASLCGAFRADDESDDDDDEPGGAASVCGDTWEFAREKPRANGLFSSTCHAWNGLAPAWQHGNCGTQGPSANRVYVGAAARADGAGASRTKLGASVAGLKKTYGSERFIDWVLVDRASLGRARRRCVHGGRRDVAEADVAVLRATVHTRRGELADYSRTSSGAHAGANWHGWGSDHFPVSADLELVLRR